MKVGMSSVLNEIINSTHFAANRLRDFSFRKGRNVQNTELSRLHVLPPPILFNPSVFGIQLSAEIQLTSF
jgi:hypothetical protein